LLPGKKGPVAQFMYRDTDNQRLTLYVSNKMALELADETLAVNRAITHPVSVPPHAHVDSSATHQIHAPPGMAFHFLKSEDLNVCYWIDGTYGYALSATTDQTRLAQVSHQVYRQRIGS